jgi:hypothetical protein
MAASLRGDAARDPGDPSAVHYSALADLYETLAAGADPATAYDSAVAVGADPIGTVLAIELVADWIDGTTRA